MTGSKLYAFGKCSHFSVNRDRITLRYLLLHKVKNKWITENIPCQHSRFSHSHINHLGKAFLAPSVKHLRELHTHLLHQKTLPKSSHQKRTSLVASAKRLVKVQVSIGTPHNYHPAQDQVEQTKYFLNTPLEMLVKAYLDKICINPLQTSNLLLQVLN